MASKEQIKTESLETVEPIGKRVLIRKDDGTYISGTGFTGDFRTRQVTFSGPVKGNYVWEEKK